MKSCGSWLTKTLAYGNGNPRSIIVIDIHYIYTYMCVGR
jgi:hypothetical protein